MIWGAPFSFIVFLAVGLTAGYGGSTWYYSKQMADDASEIARYRVALGIQPASPSALTVLTNRELSVKALNLAGQARALCLSFEKKADSPAPPKGDKKKEKENRDKYNAVAKELSQEFDRSIKADFINVNNELLRRLDPKVAGSVVRFPIFYDATTGAPVGMLNLALGEFEAPFLCGYADEMEQMAKLLPADPDKP